MRSFRNRRSKKPTLKPYYLIGGFICSAAILGGFLFLSHPDAPQTQTVQYDVDLSDGQTRRIIPDVSLVHLTQTRTDEAQDEDDIINRLSSGEEEALKLSDLANAENTAEETGDPNNSQAEADLADGGDSLLAKKFDGIVAGQERRVVNVNRGDTLMNLLLKQDIENKQAFLAIEALKQQYDPRKLRPGDEITVIIDHAGEKSTFKGLEIAPSAERTIRVSYNADEDHFETKTIEQKLTVVAVAAKGTIRSSLYEAGAEAGVPMPILARMIQLFSTEYNFKRDLQSGDSFEVLFSRSVLPDGTVVRDGDIKYAALTVNGQHQAIYRFTNNEGQVDYYDADGEALGPSIMRRPVEKAWISSPFGRRKHPTLGTYRMHWGTDYAAPRGTPIMAGGNGRISFIGRLGANGNLIRIEHGSNLRTAYAHMSRFARGLKKGSKVRRGQVIGYVGSTGRSTGPHVHYEIVYNGKRVNPVTAKLPAGVPLSSQEKKKFSKVVTAVNNEFASIRHEEEIAARNLKQIETAKQ